MANAKPFVRATLTGDVPFNSFTIPGVEPSVLVTRRGALLDSETAAKLKTALKAGKVEGVKLVDVAMDEVDAPKGSAAKTDADAFSLSDVSDDDLIAEAQSRNLPSPVRAEFEAFHGHASDVLDTLTADELRALAQKRTLTVDAKATKGDIVAALLAKPE